MTPPQRLPRLPFVLLGAMTTAVILGPFGIGYSLRGGASPIWPPDRTVEWAAVLGISGIVLALMLACLSLALVNHKVVTGSRPSPATEERP